MQREFELGPGDALVLPGKDGLIRIDVYRSPVPNAPGRTVVRVPEAVDVEMFSRRD